MATSTSVPGTAGKNRGDPFRAAQNLEDLRGKILRIDPRGAADGEFTIPPDNPFVGQPPKRGEIWSYGLRNPWRFSFDRLTGDLTIGDVGQNLWEEIDFSPRASGYGRGVNYGWSCREGRHDYISPDPRCLAPPPPVLTDPVWEYPHSGGQHTGCSIMGGYVIRDPALPAVFGRYVYGDYRISRSGTSNSRSPMRRAIRTQGRTCSRCIHFRRRRVCSRLRRPPFSAWCIA